jgi:hypothetical protein
MFNRETMAQASRAVETIEDMRAQLRRQTVALEAIEAALKKEPEKPPEAVLPKAFDISNARPSHEDTATLRLMDVIFSCNTPSQTTAHYILHVGESATLLEFWQAGGSLRRISFDGAGIIVPRGLRIWIEDVTGGSQWFALIIAYPS